jgi:hypothetical protein
LLGSIGVFLLFLQSPLLTIVLGTVLDLLEKLLSNYTPVLDIAKRLL